MSVSKQNFVYEWLNDSRKKIGVLDHVLRNFGYFTLKEYIDQFSNKNFTLQPTDDFYDSVYLYVDELMGREKAEILVKDLRSLPVVLTANHHGVDYFAQSIQTSIIYALNKFNEDKITSSVPVFSCGTVSLNNVTYPQGILLYSTNSIESFPPPQKLPLFSGRLKRSMVGSIPPFDKESVQSLRKRITIIKDKKQIPLYLMQTLEKVISEDYEDPFIMSLKSYSDQSVMINSRLWKRIFNDDPRSPELYYLEFEKIARKLLSVDLLNPDSLIYKIMFYPTTTHHILSQLDGVHTCWNNAILESRLCKNINSTRTCATGDGCGSHFFWGVGNSGRRIPLTLKATSCNERILIGMDDDWKKTQFLFSPQNLVDCMENNELIPTYFTSLLTVSLARGIVCLGGYFQGEYFPKIKEGVIRSLQKSGKNGKEIEKIEHVPVHLYLSGMSPIMIQCEKKYMVPAGPLEIIATGGVGERYRSILENTSVFNAHLGGLMETIPDVIPRDRKNERDWKISLLHSYYDNMKTNVLIK